MAKFYVGKGLDRYITALESLQRMSPHICGMAVYEGAKVIADAVAHNADSLPVVQARRVKSGDPVLGGVTQSQKEGLLSSEKGGGLGISKMRNDGGFYNVKLGYHGYNSTKTEKYPNGQPNVMIARSLERGTSFRQKIPFISRAVSSKRATAERKMAQVVDEETAKIMK